MSLSQHSIDALCPGFSGAVQWQFFHWLLKSRPDIRRVLMLGVYRGRDIGYIAHAFGDRDYEIVGVDWFEDVACNDWPPEKRGLTWEKAGYGRGPDLLS